MSEIAEFKRGAGGRPSRAEAERRLANLLDTAMRLFLERGYAAVSVEEIAKQAGVAKRFIYARYDDKAALFVAAVERVFPRQFESAVQMVTPSPEGVEQGLYELARGEVGGVVLLEQRRAGCDFGAAPHGERHQ